MIRTARLAPIAIAAILPCHAADFPNLGALAQDREGAVGGKVAGDFSRVGPAPVYITEEIVLRPDRQIHSAGVDARNARCAILGTGDGGGNDERGQKKSRGGAFHGANATPTSIPREARWWARFAPPVWPGRKQPRERP